MSRRALSQEEWEQLARRMGEQLQIGDTVVYTPEAIITTVVGYDWREVKPSDETTPHRCQLVGYQLRCGIPAARELLVPIQPTGAVGPSGEIH